MDSTSVEPRMSLQRFSKKKKVILSEWKSSEKTLYLHDVFFFIFLLHLSFPLLEFKVCNSTFHIKVLLLKAKLTNANLQGGVIFL